MIRRKKIRRLSAMLSMAVLLMAVAGGCGSSSSNGWEGAKDTVSMEAPMAASMDGGLYENAAMAEEGAGEEVPEQQVQASDRKLIKTVDMSVETEEFDTLVSNVETKVSSLGGYIEMSNVYNGSYTSNYRSRSADITARVPADKLDQFITEVAEYSNVIRKEERVEDVTLQYVDMESHKKALMAEQESLLSMLENAQSIEDIIAINEQLTDVRYRIESMESQLRTYDNKINYSTLYLNIQEVEQYEPYAPKSAGERIREGFVRNLHRVGDGISNFFIELVIALPILAVMAVVIAIVVGIVYLIIKAGEKNAEKHRQKMAERRMQMQSRQMQSRQRPAAPPMGQTEQKNAKEQKEERKE